MPPKPWPTLSDGAILTRQEQFVLRQVAKGESADLKQEFGEAEEDRCLRAQFLEKLLTGELPGVKVHRRGVQINNAIIEETLDLENGDVGVELLLYNCSFKGVVNFTGAFCKKNLLFSRSQFFREANFNGIKVESSVFLRETIFASSVDFRSAAINGHFVANKARFVDKRQGAIFNGMQIGLSARFEESEFHGGVDFGGADIKGQFVAQGVKFICESKKANFNHIQVGKSARFDAAEFHGPVDFINANIHGQFMAKGIKFFSKEHRVTFYGMQVSQEASFEGGEFYGLVSFVSIVVVGDFHLEPLLKSGPALATTFHRSVNFRGADIGGELLAEKAQFLGHLVNFESVRVGRSFHASGALFAGSVNFTDMEVNSNFYINPFGRLKGFKTLFKGPANFSRVKVRGVFNANQGIFQSDNVIFSGLKVGLGAFFNGAIFFAGLVMKEADLTDLEISGLVRLSQGGLPLTEIVLNRTRIGHRLTIRDVEVKRFEARNLEVKGPAEFSRVFIKAAADFRDAACHHLQMVEVDWPEPRDRGKRVYLDGLTYESITARKEPDKPEEWPKLLAWLGLSRFNTQNYQELDGFFQRGGLRPWADKVHMAGKRRELGKLKWWNPGRWLTRFFWGWLAGYGRKPGRVFWPSLALVLLGWLIFQPVCLEPQHWLASFQQSHPAWTGLVVSLDRFLPGVDLGVAKICRPGDLSPLVWFYWHFLKIMGWILAPIALAAIYTRIK
jgi:hypothetical protein